MAGFHIQDQVKTEVFKGHIHAVSLEVGDWNSLVAAVAKIDGRTGKVQSRGRLGSHGCGQVTQAAAASGSDLEEILTGRTGARR